VPTQLSVCDGIPPPPVEIPEGGPSSSYEPTALPPGDVQPCPGDERTTALELYMGQSGGASVYRFGDDYTDDGQTITGELLTNALSPEGYGGEFLFTTFFLAATVTWRRDGRHWPDPPEASPPGPGHASDFSANSL